MIVIKPIEMTEARLNSSNIPENEYSGWSSSVVYTTGQKVIYDHQIWEALRGNTNKTPSSDNPLDWLTLGSTNRWAMFDQKVSTQTSGATSIEFEIEPGEQFNSVAFFNVEGASISIDVVETVASVETTIEMRSSTLRSTLPAATWWDYFHYEPTEKTELVFLNLPTTARSRLLITVHPIGTNQARCGTFVVGKAKSIGETLYGITTGITRYSIINRDEFGEITIKKRGYSDRSNFPLRVDKALFSSVRRYLAGIESDPCVFIGHESEESTIIYGLYKDFDMAVNGYNDYTLNINIDGLL